MKSVRSPNLNVVGAMLKAARELAGHTQSSMAAEIGVDRSAVSRWESDDPKEQPSAANFKRICQVLRVKPESLLAVPDDKAA